MVVALLLGFGATSAQAAGPAAISRADGILDVFKRNPANGDLQWNEWTYWGGWMGWQSLGGPFHPDTEIGVATRNGNHFSIYARGMDNRLYQRAWDGSAWTGWIDHGGVLTGGPSAVSWDGNREDVFVRDSAGALVHRGWDPWAGWSGWINLGGVLAPGTGPAAGSRAAGDLDVAVTGTDHRLYIKRYRPASGWSDYYAVESYLSGGPSVSQIPGEGAAGRQDYHGIASNGAVVYNTWAGGGHSQWYNLDGQVSANRAPAALWWRDRPGAALRQDIFTYGTGDTTTLFHKFWTAGTGFTGWGAVPEGAVSAGNQINSDGQADAFIATFQASSEGDAVARYQALTADDRAWVDRRMAATLLDGTLYRVPNAPAVYLFENGTKQWITSPEAANDWGFDLNSQRWATGGALSQIGNGDNIDTLSLSAVDAPATDDLASAVEEEDPDIAMPAAGVKVDKTYKCTSSGSVRNAPKALAIGWCVSKNTEKDNPNVKQGYFTVTYSRPTLGMYNGWTGSNLQSCGRLLTSHALGPKPRAAEPRWGHGCGSLGVKENVFASLIADPDCVNDEWIVGDSNPYGPSDCRAGKWDMTAGEPGQYVYVKAGMTCPRYLNVDLTGSSMIGRDPIRDPVKSRDQGKFVQEAIPAGQRVIWRYLSRNRFWVMAQWVHGSHNWAFIPASCVPQPPEYQWMTKDRANRPNAKDVQLRVVRQAQGRYSRLRR